MAGAGIVCAGVNDAEGGKGRDGCGGDVAGAGWPAGGSVGTGVACAEMREGDGERGSGASKEWEGEEARGHNWGGNCRLECCPYDFQRFSCVRHMFIRY